MDGGVVVLFHQFLADDDGVFEVVTAPGHESDENVSAEGQFALIGTRTVGEYITFFHPAADLNDGLLGDTGVLIRAFELSEGVDVRADFAGHLPFVSGGTIHTDDNAFGVDRVDNAGALTDDDRAGVASGDHFHASADVRSIRTQQRDGLALHVRTHQGAIGVVVLKERDQRGRDRDQLLRTNIHKLDLIPVQEGEITCLTGVDEFIDDVTGLV